jgi:hypothetical protein
LPIAAAADDLTISDSSRERARDGVGQAEREVTVSGWIEECGRSTSKREIRRCRPVASPSSGPGGLSPSTDASVRTGATKR